MAKCTDFVRKFCHIIIFLKSKILKEKFCQIKKPGVPLKLSCPKDSKKGLIYPRNSPRDTPRPLKLSPNIIGRIKSSAKLIVHI